MQRPNPDDTWLDLFRKRDEYIKRHGFALFWFVPDDMGETKEVWAIDPFLTTPYPADMKYIHGYYVLLKKSGEFICKIPAEQIRRVKIESPPILPTRDTGESPSQTGGSV